MNNAPRHNQNEKNAAQATDFSQPILATDQHNTLGGPTGHNPFAAPSTGNAQNPAASQAIIDRGMSTTRLGLNLVFYSTIFAMLSLISSSVSGMAAYFIDDSRFQFAQIIGVLLFSCGATFFIGATIALIGQCFCTAVPTVTRSRGLIYASVLLQVVGLIAGVLTFIFMLYLPTAFDANDYWFDWFVFGTFVFCNSIRVASTVAFMLFMRRLAKHFELNGTSRIATWLALSLVAVAMLITGLTTTAYSMQISDVFNTSRGGMLFTIATAIGTIYFTIATVAYCYVIFKLTQAIKNSMIRVAIPVV